LDPKIFGEAIGLETSRGFAATKTFLYVLSSASRATLLVKRDDAD